MPEAFVICGEREASCVCVLPAGHDQRLHECVTCGGSWGYTDEGKFVVGSWPSPPGSGRER